MADFKKFGGNRKGGDTFNRGPGGRPGFGGGRDGGEREMFKATCAECGKPCEVPFRPSGDRPVYCKDCFQAMGPQERRDMPRGPSQGAPRRDFAPRPYTPAPAQGSGEDKRLDDLKIQNATIISKLDKLINLQVNSPSASSAQKAKSNPATLRDTIASATKKAKAAPKKKAPKKK